MENYTLNDGNGKEVTLEAQDFEFVQNHTKIHDVKLKTKATTFFKDAMKRFFKSKASVTGGVIVGALMLLAFIVPLCTPNEGVYNTEPGKGGTVSETFLTPKLFPAGTGFWDGTQKKKDVIFDSKTNLPVGYAENTISNLQTEVRLTDGVSSEYGTGGYVSVYCTTKTSNSNYYSSAADFAIDETYQITYVISDATKTGYEFNGYKFSFLDTTTNKHHYLKGTETSFEKNRGTVTIDLKLSDFGYSTTAENSTVNGKLYFEVQKSETETGFLPLESVKVEAPTESENDKLIKSLSFKDGNEALLRKREDINSWIGDFGFVANQVQLTYCSFTYDQYEAVYGKIDHTYGARELTVFELNNSFKMNFAKEGTKATNDLEVLKKRFEILNDDCPIVEVVEQIGDAKKGANGRYTGFSLKVKVMKYKSLGYDKMPIFIFGTNGNGQDYFKLLFTGLRFSFFLAIGVSFVNIFIGLIWGSISGYFGGWTDILMERFCDILSGLPLTVIVTLCILYGQEFNWGNASDVIALLLSLFLTGWMGVAHQTRTQFYRFKGREYVLASRTLGAKDGRLIFKHILPNAAGTIITGSVLIIPSVIYTEASIAYLGLGLKNQTLFGVILASANSYYTGEKSFLLFIPTIIMMFLLISFNLFGNGLRDAFNPQLKGSE